VKRNDFTWSKTFGIDEFIRPLIFSRRMNSSILFFLLFFFQSCQQKSVDIQPAFYHWQTKLDLTSREINYLSELNVQKIYPKFFDVDWNFNQQEAVAKASLMVDSALPDIIEIVPTVFITNRTLVNVSAEKLPDLAQKIKVPNKNISFY